MLLKFPLAFLRSCRTFIYILYQYLLYKATFSYTLFYNFPTQDLIINSYYGYIEELGRAKSQSCLFFLLLEKLADGIHVRFMYKNTGLVQN